MIPDEARAAGIPDASNTQASRFLDVPQQWPVVSSVEDARGPIVTLRSDTVRMPDGDIFVRQVVDHPGAVAVVALDEAARILMIRQYRHPVGRLLWELPAGLRDVDGEPLLATAERELLEETGYRARDWLVLADFFTSPGITTERIRMFLARGLTLVPESEREYIPRHEEAHLLVGWVPLEEAVARFLAGDLHNGVTGVGILSAYAASQIGFTALRRPDAPEH
jgi:8-oxo-dGTP pyrophosphatase MutT (NUDIX family)